MAKKSRNQKNRQRPERSPQQTRSSGPQAEERATHHEADEARKGQERNFSEG